MLRRLLTASLLLLLAPWTQAQNTPPAFQWSVPAGGTSSDEGRGVVADAQGNVYVAGIFRGTATFGAGAQQATLVSTPPGSGTTITSDAFLARYSPTGTLQWAMRHGGPGNDEALGLAIDRGGNLLMVGTFTETATFGAGTAAVPLTSAGADDVFLTKFDPAGTLLWARRLGGSSTSAENGYAVATDSVGNVIITGDYRDQATLSGSTAVLSSAGGSDAFIAKYDPAGALLWVRRGTGTGITDAGRAIATDRAGNIVLTGSFRERVTFEGAPAAPPVVLRARVSADLFVVKYDPNGNPLWGRLATGGASEIGRAIVTDQRKAVYVLTSFRTQAYFLSTTDSTLATIPTTNLDDVALVKYSPSGAVEWVRVDGGPGSDESIALCADPANNVYALNYFQQTATFGSGSAGSTPVQFTSAGTSDVGIACYSAAGAFRWAQRLGGPGTDTGYGIGYDATGQLVLTGYFTGGPFAAGNGQFPLFTQPSNIRDIFVARTLAVPTASRASRLSGLAVQLYPNPTAATVRLAVPTGQPRQLALLDAVGRAVRTYALAGPTAEVSVRGLAAGRYTAVLTFVDGRRATAPLLVQP